MAYQSSPKVTQGNETKAVVTDNDVQNILYKILSELKKMNLYLSLITDNQIGDSDIK